VFFAIFGCEAHKQYCVEMARDRQGQHARLMSVAQITCIQ